MTEPTFREALSVTGLHIRVVVVTDKGSRRRVRL